MKNGTKKKQKGGGKTARRKGHQFEREIAIALRKIFPNARRHLEYQDQEANGVDIVETGNYRFQCKRGRKPASVSALKEIQCDEFCGEVPVLVTQGDHERVLAVLPFEVLLKLIEAEKDFVYCKSMKF